jgi:RNA polymerase-binding transcription factor DksA
MNTEQIKKHKDALLEEKNLLENELKSVGRINPENPSDWEPVPPKEDDGSIIDPNELGTKFEEYEENTAILKPLETRYNCVKKALEKIESGKSFGICEVCGKLIEEDRLAVNPAAETCKAHM